MYLGPREELRLPEDPRRVIAATTTMTNPRKKRLAFAISTHLLLQYSILAALTTIKYLSGSQHQGLPAPVGGLVIRDDEGIGRF
jgi:hypothetical protein